MVNERGELKKSLNPVAIWSIALGTIIGFGCFVMPGDWLKLGGPLGILIGFTLGGMIMVVISISYGYMVKHVPVAGGECAYAHCSLGGPHGMIVGWGLVLAYGMIVPLNATALSLVGRYVVPDIFMQGYLYTISGWDVYLPDIILPLLVVVIYGIINYRGVKQVGNVQTATTLVMVGAVLILLASALTYEGFSLDNFKPLFAPGKTSAASILAVLAITPWAYCGFDTIPQSAEEHGFDSRKLPFLLMISIVSGGLMYICTSMTTASPMPWTELVALEGGWATRAAVKMTMGTAGVALLVVAMVMGVATGINGQMLSSTRVLFSMGRAKILPEWFSKVNSHGVPGNAVIFITIMSVVFPLFGREVISWIVNMAAVGNALGYGYTCVAAFLLSKKIPELSVSSVRRFVFLLGALFAGMLLFLLLVPGMPGSLRPFELAFLVIWSVLGAILHISHKRKVHLTQEEADWCMLGEYKKYVVYKKK